ERSNGRAQQAISVRLPVGKQRKRCPVPTALWSWSPRAPAVITLRPRLDPDRLVSSWGAAGGSSRPCRLPLRPQPPQDLQTRPPVEERPPSGRAADLDDLAV